MNLKIILIVLVLIGGAAFSFISALGSSGGDYTVAAIVAGLTVVVGGGLGFLLHKVLP